MTKRILIILTLVLSFSCSKHNVKLQGIPNNFKVDANIGPDLEKASKACDDRYGKRTPESNKCFENFLKFYKIELTLNLDAITAYCEKKYEDVAELNKCEDDLLDILDFAPKAEETESK